MYSGHYTLKCLPSMPVLFLFQAPVLPANNTVINTSSTQPLPMHVTMEDKIEEVGGRKMQRVANCLFQNVLGCQKCVPPPLHVFDYWAKIILQVLAQPLYNVHSNNNSVDIKSPVEDPGLRLGIDRSYLWIPRA